MVGRKRLASNEAGKPATAVVRPSYGYAQANRRMRIRYRRRSVTASQAKAVLFIFQPEACFDRDLILRHFSIVDLATDLHHLEPAQMP